MVLVVAGQLAARRLTDCLPACLPAGRPAGLLGHLLLPDLSREPAARSLQRTLIQANPRAFSLWSLLIVNSVNARIKMCVSLAFHRKCVSK